MYLDLELLTFHNTRPTAISSIVEKHRLCGTHNHVWLFGSGNHAGILKRSCALGRGLYLLNVVNRPRTATFLDNLAENAGSSAAKRWLAVALERDEGSDMAVCLTMQDFPESGFPENQAFHEWWDANKESLEHWLSLNKRPTED